MKIIKIKELQKNPSSITKALKNNEYVLITKRNKPIGIDYKRLKNFFINRSL